MYSTLKIYLPRCIFFNFAISFIFAISVQAQTVYQAESINDSTGKLIYVTEVDSFYVVIDEDFRDARKYASGDSIVVNAGKHKIRLVKKYYRDLIDHIEIVPGANMVIRANLQPFRNFEYFKYHSSYPRIYWQSAFVVKTETDAVLYVDGSFIGKGFGRVDTTGSFTVRSELPSGRAVYATFQVNNHQQSFHVRELYLRPDKKKSKFLSFFPGISQIYQRDKWKGYALLGTIAAGTALAFKYQQNYSSKYAEFMVTREQYRESPDPQEVFELGNQAEQQLQEATRLANTRDVFIYTTIGVYLYNIVDGMLRPDTGYRRKIEIDPFIEFDPVYNRKMGVSAAYKF